MKTVRRKPISQKKNGLIQARVSNAELQAIVTKAVLYTNGRVGEYIRTACLNYRPIKRVTIERHKA